MLKSFPKILLTFFLAIFIFQLASLIFLAVVPNAGLAADPATFKPQVQIPGMNAPDAFGAPDKNGGYAIPGSTASIGKYIRVIYKYAIGIVGIIAAVVLMVGGVMWIVAAGNATAIGEAKAWIGASLTGLLLALLSYLILATVNPALVDFQTTGIQTVAEVKNQSSLAENDPCVSGQAPYCMPGLDCTNGKCARSTETNNACKSGNYQWVKTGDCSSINKINYADYFCTCISAKNDSSYRCCGGTSVNNTTAPTAPQGGCCVGPKGSLEYTQCFDGQSLTQNDCYFLTNGTPVFGDYIPNKKCADILTANGSARKACQ